MKGSSVKDLTFNEKDGKIEVEGYLFRYSDPADSKDRDLHNQWWSKDTYLMQETFPVVGIPIMFSHSTQKELSRVGIGVVTFAQEDDIGLFIKGQLHDRAKWEKVVEEVNQRRKLGFERKHVEQLADNGYKNFQQILSEIPLQWSMGSYPPTYLADKKTGKIETAGIVEATLTPIPAEPFGTGVDVTFKSFLDVISLEEPGAKEAFDRENDNKFNSKQSQDGKKKMPEDPKEEVQITSDERLKKFASDMSKEFMRMMGDEMAKFSPMEEPSEEENEEIKSYFSDELQKAVSKDTGYQKALEDKNYENMKSIVTQVYDSNLTEIIERSVGRHMESITERADKSRKAFSGAMAKHMQDNPEPRSKSDGNGGFQESEKTSKYLNPADIKDYEDLNIGDFFRDLALGRTSEHRKNYTESQKALNPYNGPLGGVLQGQEMSQQILAPLRAQAVTAKMGVKQTSIKNVGIYTVPKMTTVPTAYRPGINDQITETEAKYHVIQAMLRPLAARIVIPRQLLMTTGTNVEAQIKEEVIKSLRLQVDKEVLIGVGNVAGSGNTGAEIKGIKTHLLQSGLTANTPTLATNGRAPKYEDLIDAETQIGIGNVELDDSTSGWIMHPRDRGTFRRTLDANGNPLLYPSFADKAYQEMIGYRVATTTQIPINQTTGTNTDTSDIYFGNWAFSEYITGNDIEVIYDETTRADQLQVRFIVYLYSDFIVHYPEAFYVMQGVRA